MPRTEPGRKYGTLVREFMDLYEGLRSDTTADEQWVDYFYNTCVLEFNKSVQNHLKGCRSQSKLHQVRQREMSTFNWHVPPSHVELGSICKAGMDELCEGDGLPAMLLDTVQQKRAQILDLVMNKLQVSQDEMDQTQRFVDTHVSPTFADMRAMTAEASKWVSLHEQRGPLLSAIAEVERVLGLNNEFYLSTLVPMHVEAQRLFAVSTRDLFVADADEFLEACQKFLEAKIQQLSPLVKQYEADTGQHGFHVDGTAWETRLRMLSPIKEHDDVAPAAPKRASSSTSHGPHPPRRVSSLTNQKKPSASMQSSTSRPYMGKRTASSEHTALNRRPSGSRRSAHDVLRSTLPQPSDTPAGFAISSEPAPSRGPEPPEFATVDQGGQSVGNVTILHGTSLSDGVNVVVRVRPMLRRELRGNERAGVVVQGDGRTVHVVEAASKRSSLTFGDVASPEVRQDHFWKLTRMGQMVDEAMSGVFGTVMAYGQTGSGKTHSIAGPEGTVGIDRGSQLSNEGGDIPSEVLSMVNGMLRDHLEQHGLIPRIASDLFLKVRQKEANDSSLRYQIKVSYLEIYNEQVNDLLADQPPLRLRERVGDQVGFFADGLTEVECTDLPCMLNAIVDGTRRRKVVSHQMNAQSSRSHAILIVHVAEKRLEQGTLFLRHGKLTIVDLAGSESVKKTKTAGQSLLETAGINKSLLSLSNVIVELHKNQKGHVAWRDSKLTQLLQDSLMGDGMTTLIACVSPSEEQLAETHSTLQFATKAGKISKRKVKERSPHEVEIERLTSLWQDSVKEVEFLRRVVAAAGIECPQYVPGGENDIEDGDIVARVRLNPPRRGRPETRNDAKPDPDARTSSSPPRQRHRVSASMSPPSQGRDRLPVQNNRFGNFGYASAGTVSEIPETDATDSMRDDDAQVDAAIRRMSASYEPVSFDDFKLDVHNHITTAPWNDLAFS